LTISKKGVEIRLYQNSESRGKGALEDVVCRKISVKRKELLKMFAARKVWRERTS